MPECDDGREVLRHSTAHVLAEAVTRLFPGAKYAIGPAIADGFYYDFELPGGQTFSEDDLGRIEAEMRAIVKQDQRFEREEVSYDGRALGVRRPAVQAEIIEKGARAKPTGEDAGEAGGDSGVSLYRNVVDGQAAFVDLCRGPHVPSTKRLGVFKFTKVAGAYWRGNEKGPMLQRIYGTAWELRQGGQAGGRLGVVIAVVGLHNIERLPVQSFGFAVITQVALNGAETSEIIGDQRVASAIDPAVHFQDASVQGSANLVVAGGILCIR